MYCWCCKINHAEVNCVYCTFCRLQMAKGNLKFDLWGKNNDKK